VTVVLAGFNTLRSSKRHKFMVS